MRALCQKTCQGPPITGASITLPKRASVWFQGPHGLCPHFPCITPTASLQKPPPFPAFTSASHFHPQQAWLTIHGLWEQNRHWSKSQSNRCRWFCDTLEYKKRPHFFNVLNQIKPLSCPACKRIKTCQIPEIFHDLSLPPTPHKKPGAYSEQKLREGPWSSIHLFNDTQELLVQNVMVIFSVFILQHLTWFISASSQTTFSLSPSLAVTLLVPPPLL